MQRANILPAVPPETLSVPPPMETVRSLMSAGARANGKCLVSHEQALAMLQEIIPLQQASDADIDWSWEDDDFPPHFFESWAGDHILTAYALMKIMEAHPDGGFTVHIPAYGNDVTPPMTEEEKLAWTSNMSRMITFPDES